jgi:hypothetical protein
MAHREEVSYSPWGEESERSGLQEDFSEGMCLGVNK